MLRVEFLGVNPTVIRARAWAVGTKRALELAAQCHRRQQCGAGRRGDRGASAQRGHSPCPHPSPSIATEQPRSRLRRHHPLSPATVSSGRLRAAGETRTAEDGGRSSARPGTGPRSGGAGNVTVGAAGEERAYLSSFTVQDVDVVERVVLPTCDTNDCGAFVLGRYSPAYSPTYYRVGVVQGAGGDIFLRGQRSDGSNLASDLDTGIPAADGAQVMLRVEFQGANPTVIRARAWRAGTAEPTNWLLNTTDNTSAEQKAGMLGVRLQNEDTGARPYLPDYEPASDWEREPGDSNSQPDRGGALALRRQRRQGLRLRHRQQPHARQAVPHPRAGQAGRHGRSRPTPPVRQRVRPGQSAPAATEACSPTTSCTTLWRG